MKKLILILLTSMLVLLIAFSCSKKAIEELYTNPDAIVDVLNAKPFSQEANDFNFITNNEFELFTAPLSGSFGTSKFKLTLDSSQTSYDIDVGDTVIVDGLTGKEAFANVQFQNFYTLTLANGSGESITKQLETNPIRAYKRSYMLQLGSFSSSGRGWVHWGTSTLFNLGQYEPNITWSSKAKGVLNNSDNIIYRNDFEPLSPGDRITVKYAGHSDDIAYLNINEGNDLHRIKFSYKSETEQEASWTISSNPSGKDYYFYAGVEIYRHETLSSENIAQIEFFLTGLMYSIETE